jgi:hypothetical protein
MFGAATINGQVDFLSRPRSECLDWSIKLLIDRTDRSIVRSKFVAVSETGYSETCLRGGPLVAQSRCTTAQHRNDRRGSSGADWADCDRCAGLKTSSRGRSSHPAAAPPAPFRPTNDPHRLRRRRSPPLHCHPYRCTRTRCATMRATRTRTRSAAQFPRAHHLIAFMNSGGPPRSSRPGPSPSRADRRRRRRLRHGRGGGLHLPFHAGGPVWRRCPPSGATAMSYRRAAW